MLTKEPELETKVKHLEIKLKKEVDELKEEICILKTQTEELVSTRIDPVEEASNIIVKELKGRNVTIIKTKTENDTPKTVTTSKLTDEENTVTMNSETPKPKPKRIKIIRKVIEERLISSYVFDAEIMLKDFESSELDEIAQTCKRCEFDTYSEGMLRRHKVLIHDSGK